MRFGNPPAPYEMPPSHIHLSVDRRLLPIVGRAVSTMIHFSGCNDIFRIYMTSRRDGVDYNLAYIGPDFTVGHKETFDRAYMRALFNYGYQRARMGHHWSKAPPGFQATDQLQATNVSTR